MHRTIPQGVSAYRSPPFPDVRSRASVGPILGAMVEGETYDDHENTAKPNQQR